MRSYNTIFIESEAVEFHTILASNGFVFIGATNSIIQLNKNLSLLRQFNVGPANDDVSCLSPLLCNNNSHYEVCSGEVRCTNNYNTLLLTYRDRLLACGTLYETCDLLQIDNISVRYGSKYELQCPRDGITSKMIRITRQNPLFSVVATVYLNDTSNDNDLLYLGRSPGPIRTLIAPSLTNTYFTLVDDVSQYVSEQISGRRANYHLAWTDAKYAYILWSDETNNQLKLSRYCNQIVSHLSRELIENVTIFGIVEGVRTYTEITLQCNFEKQLTANDVISAKVAFNNVYILYHNRRGKAVISSASISELNDEFNFVRSQCWNTTGSNRFANVLSRLGTGLSSCFKLDSYTNDWVRKQNFLNFYFSDHLSNFILS